MSPETRIIDRRFRGVGRICRHSGTTDLRVFKRINVMLAELYDQGRLDLLRAVRDKKIVAVDLYDAYRRGAIDSVAMGATAKPLAAAVREWAADYDCSEHYRKTIGTTANYLEAADPRALVVDLPRVLEELRSSMGKTKRVSFNRTRAHCLAFARSTLKRSHRIWIEASAVESVKVPEAGQRKKVRLSPDEMRERFPHPATNQTDAIAWGMVTTGMHAAEYWGHWHVGRSPATHVHIDGTKRKARKRDVPLVHPPTPPRVHRRTWEDAIRARHADMVPYDLRGTYSHWMEMAGIPRTRRRQYMGQGTADVLELYERADVARYLEEDASKMKAHIGTIPGAQTLTLVAEDEK